MEFGSSKFCSRVILGNIDWKCHCEDSDSDGDNADLYQCLGDVSYDRSDLEVPYTLLLVFLSLSVLLHLSFDCIVAEIVSFLSCKISGQEFPDSQIWVYSFHICGCDFCNSN